MSTLIVIPRSDCFCTLWPELALAASAELKLVSGVDELGTDADALLVVLNVAGMEEEAEPCLRSLRAGGISAPIVVGARADHRLATTLLHAGAADYFALPPDLNALRGLIEERARRFTARASGQRLTAAEQSAYDFQRIIGSSPALRSALDRAARIIPRDRATILLTGETGTGKELMARAIHYNGPRASAPFVEINCTAIPVNLLESELFGHERGAFTDARAAKPGLFEAADGGTLFLDEIGDLPIELQGKLLKVLEEKRVRRVGAVRTRDVDVRIIAATHVDLAEAVRRGRFREDLFYRLAVIPIHLPPLRERGRDVLLLTDHFIRTLAAQYDLPHPSVPRALEHALLVHTWPGNVRELRNSLERALLLGDGQLDPKDLFPGPSVHQPSGSSGIPFPASLAEIERAAAQAMLEHMDGNKVAAAQALGISRSRLYRRLDGDVVAQ